MKITKSSRRKITAGRSLGEKRNTQNPYMYFTKHGIGPGTLPRDVKLVDWKNLDDYMTVIYVDRPLSTKELDNYDIIPETRNRELMKEYGITSSTCSKRKFTVQASRISAAADNTVSQEDVDEFVLYITNDGRLYEQVAKPIIKSMKRKRKNGNYDDSLAVKGWMHLADESVRRYDKEFGSGRGSLTMLNKATRMAIAEELKEYYEDIVSYEEQAVQSADDTKTYTITYDRYQDTITVDSFESEQDAVDKLIDKLEAEGSTGCFVNPDEYNEDEYVIGGNHGLALYHGGNFMIEEAGSVESSSINAGERINIDEWENNYEPDEYSTDPEGLGYEQNKAISLVGDILDDWANRTPTQLDNSIIDEVYDLACSKPKSCKELADEVYSILEEAYPELVESSTINAGIYTKAVPESVGKPVTDMEYIQKLADGVVDELNAYYDGYTTCYADISDTAITFNSNEYADIYIQPLDGIIADESDLESDIEELSNCVIGNWMPGF